MAMVLTQNSGSGASDVTKNYHSEAKNSGFSSNITCDDPFLRSNSLSITKDDLPIRTNPKELYME